MDAINWAWMLEGLCALKKFGLVSFWSPAKQKVKPRNARSGSSAHEAIALAWGGGDQNTQRAGRFMTVLVFGLPGRVLTGFELTVRTGRLRCDISPVWRTGAERPLKHRVHRASSSTTG